MTSIRLALIGLLTGAMIFHVSGNTILIDSLRRLVGTQENSREKADNLYILGMEYIRKFELDSALACAEQSLMLSFDIQYQEGIADAQYLKCNAYKKGGRHDEAMTAAGKMLKIARELNDSTRLPKAYYQISDILLYRGETDSAASIFHECLAIIVARKDTNGIMSVTNAMGNMFQGLSEFDSAAYYYHWAIRTSEASGNYRNLAKIYNNLGKTLSRMEEYEQARQYLQKALEYNKTNADDYTNALILLNLGGTYLEEQNAEMAAVYYDRAAEIYKNFGDITDVYDLHNNYAEVYELMGRYDLALQHLDKAIEGYARLNYAEGLSVALKNKGDIYTRQGQHALAGAALDSSMAVAARAGYQKLQLDILAAMATNNEKAGDYRKAYENETERFGLFREIFDLEKDRTIKSLNIRYEKEKDQAEILALKNANLEMELDLRKKTIQRNGYLYAGLGIIILGVFLFLYLRQRVTIARQKILQLEEEKKLMAAQLLVEGQEQERKRIARELHDGLGVLLSATKMQFTSIKDAGPENQPLIEKATQLLEQATGDVRKISHNMMPGSLTKLGLYEAVEDLFDSINDAEDIHAVCEISGDPVRMPENKEIMLYRILQELVNNTLKHAEAKNVSLKIKAFQGFLQVKFSDDGIGFDVKTMFHPHTESFGLKNLQSRVGFLNGEMDVNSKPGEGVEYIIQVPV